MTNRSNPKARKKAKKLYSAAFNKVEQSADKIVEFLYNSTEKGGVMSAKLLVDLAEENLDLDEALEVGPLRSLALRLAARPQWNGDRQAAKPALETDPGNDADDPAAE
jgi:hypothetical protein